jgi:hypothetical protein
VNRATPQMRRIAQQLIRYEAQGRVSSAKTASATFQVTDRLRPQLAMLMGHGGFRALLARALALASAEVSWLAKVLVSADGTLEGSATLHAGLKPADIREGQIVLLAHLLGLLVALIGPTLTSRLVGEIWPQLATENIDPWIGDGE